MANENKKTKQLILLIIAVVIACAGLTWFIAGGNSSGAGNNSGDAASGTLSLYYRTDCAHCQNVEKFMQENNVTASIPVVMKEVMNNVENNNDLMVRATNCGYDISSVGVPLLYDHGTCYSGDEEIINYFKQKLNK